jgi:AraC-like DNA-binding protein/quercetin dioxygenase-like cupin family protein
MPQPGTDSDARCGRVSQVSGTGFVLSAFRLAAGYRSSKHAHASPGLVLPLAGALKLTAGPADTVVHPTEALFLPPGLGHSEHAPRPAECLLLEQVGSAGGEPLDRLESLRPLRHPELQAAALRLARRLESGVGMDWEFEYEAVELVLLVSQAGVRQLAADPGRPRWIERITERLHEEFRRPPSLRQMARDAGVSREHLARAVRRTTGQTPGELVRRRRVLEATRLLRTSPLTLASVALAVGFTDQSHLTRALRRYLGITPSALRTGVRRTRTPV